MGSDAQEPARPRRRRRRRRASVLTGAAVALLLVVLVGAGALQQDSSEEVTADPPRTAIEDGVRTLGDVNGVSVEVEPRTNLQDGDVVDVRISGLENLPNAILALCVGDVTGADVLSSCDFGGVHNPASGATSQVQAQAEQQVSVARTILVSRDSADPNQTRPYDCAVEAAGCVLAVGEQALPTRAVLVLLDFEDSAVPEPGAMVQPASELSEGQEITLEANGLRPNSASTVSLCTAEIPDVCDIYAVATASTNADGMLSTPVTVWSALYTFQGPIDCTAQSCIISVRQGAHVAGSPYAFAASVTAAAPTLTIEPPGPYTDQQEVTVQGRGFRPGLDLSGELGQCPAEVETAVEERCGYWDLQGPIADLDGEFTTNFQLFAQTPHGADCPSAPGCLLGWVTQNGPTVAGVPLDFTS